MDKLNLVKKTRPCAEQEKIIIHTFRKVITISINSQLQYLIHHMLVIGDDERNTTPDFLQIKLIQWL